MLHIIVCFASRNVRMIDRAKMHVIAYTDMQSLKYPKLTGIKRIEVNDI